MSASDWVISFGLGFMAWGVVFWVAAFTVWIMKERKK